MFKFFPTFFISALVSITVLGGTQNVARASLSADQISQTQNPCGDTNGNGQIVKIGNDSFTLQRNDGRNLLVKLTSQSTIETSTGIVTMSDLKVGDRVTLVGGDNHDGSFTAGAVAVCNETRENQAADSNSITVRNNDDIYRKVNGAISTVILLLMGLIWLSAVLFLRLKKKKSLVYLFFFTVFYVYLYKVLDYTLLQFQSLLILRHFLPHLILNGVQSGKALNLIPLAAFTREDVKTSLLNILMMLPFGFGLPFVTSFRLKRVVIAGLLLSIVIETMQLVTGFMANTTFRVADINDLIFNTFGVAVGYLLFVAFLHTYRRIYRHRRAPTNPILLYVTQRPQVDR